MKINKTGLMKTGIRMFVVAMIMSGFGCVSHDTAMQQNNRAVVGQYPEIITAPFESRQSLESKIAKPNAEKRWMAYSDEELFSLTSEQEARFKSWFYASQRADIAPHKRLYEYLENYTYGFDYRGKTYTAAEAMALRAGNCLSLAMMTTALARIAGIETGYQKVNATPVFKKESDVLTLSHHVPTYLYDPTWQQQKNEIAFIRPRLVVDYFPNRYDVPGEALSEQQFIGMYFRNLAVEALVSDDINSAFWLAYRALRSAANDAENINLMAIVYRRAGLPDTAENFYRYGMLNAHNNTNLISNYALLLQQQGRVAEADNLQQKLLDYPDNNPYSWIKLGHEAWQKNNNQLAIHYYNKALKLAPYLDEIYFGLAKSLYRTGEYAKAAAAMQMAAEKSWEQSERELYYAKLAALRARKFE